MERKTIGGFIAALRKANGMTQKELAERLNVSDKSVSRWERDDGAPDLSLIPVIAEIFDVTCDELLRGERRPASARDEPLPGGEPTAKAEKQRQRILALSLYKYKTRSFVAMGLSGLGLIAAMILNLGFLRASLGFLAGLIFYLASAVCQIIFLSSAFFSVADCAPDDAGVGRFKWSAVRLAEWSFGLTFVLFGVTLPLLDHVHGAYVGLSASYWAMYGAVYGLLAFLLAFAVCHLVNGALLKKEAYALSEKEDRAYRHNHALARKCAGVLLALMAVTFAGQFVLTEFVGNTGLVEGTVFEDYDSFTAYMEQDIPYDSFDSAPMTPAPSAEEPTGEITWYDEHGNVITEEEALRRTLTDGNGEVVEYMHRNAQVVHLRYGSRDGTLLPITAYTNHDLTVGNVRLNLLNRVIAAFYFIETAAVLAYYARKRAK